MSNKRNRRRKPRRIRAVMMTPPWHLRDDATFRRNQRTIYRIYQRGDEPWTLAEDRRLEVGAAKIASMTSSKRRDAWGRLAKRFGRTMPAVQTRLSVIRAADRLCRARTAENARRPRKIRSPRGSHRSGLTLRRR